MKMTAMAGRRARVMTARPLKEALSVCIPVFLAAQANVAGMHPFGISLFGALLPTPIGAAALSIGALLTGLSGIKYILCAAAFLTVIFLRKLDTIAACLVMGLIVLLGGLLEMLWNTPGIIPGISAISEAIAAGLLFYIFASLRSSSLYGISDTSREKMLARLLIVGSCANAFTGIIIPPGIHLNILAGLLALMFISTGVGFCEAVTSGVLLGVMSAMSSSDALSVMAVFAAAAFFSSLLKELGKWAAVLGVLCGCALCILCSNNYYDALTYLWSVIAAAGIYAIIPEFAIDWTGDKIRAVTNDYSVKDEHRRIEKKLKLVTRQHSEIYSSLKKINEELEREDETEDISAIYCISSAVTQRSAGGAEVCGDCYLEFDSDLGRHYIILCDGMGSGKKAYRESKMTAELLREFLKSGFLKDKAVSMLNSLLAVKGDDESFSTVDLFEFDMHTGDAEFLKIGSAQSYIRRKDEIETLCSACLPVGILDEVRTYVISRRLSAGDIVVMMSDGVGEAGYGVLKGEWIKRMIKSANGDMKALADNILAEAQRRSYPEKDDDMTVAVLRIERAKKSAPIVE